MIGLGRIGCKFLKTLALSSCQDIHIVCYPLSLASLFICFSISCVKLLIYIKSDIHIVFLSVSKRFWLSVMLSWKWKCWFIWCQEIIRHHRDKVNHPISMYTTKSLLYQLLNGLNYLHRYGIALVLLLWYWWLVRLVCTVTWLLLWMSSCSNWIIHRDLKPSNILVWPIGYFILCMCDYVPM